MEVLVEVVVVVWTAPRGRRRAVHARPCPGLDVGHPPDGEMIGLTGLTAAADGVAADVTGGGFRICLLLPVWR